MYAPAPDVYTHYSLSLSLSLSLSHPARSKLIATHIGSESAANQAQARDDVPSSASFPAPPTCPVQIAEQDTAQSIQSAAIASPLPPPAIIHHDSLLTGDVGGLTEGGEEGQMPGSPPHEDASMQDGNLLPLLPASPNIHMAASSAHPRTPAPLREQDMYDALPQQAAAGQATDHAQWAEEEVMHVANMQGSAPAQGTKGDAPSGGDDSGSAGPLQGSAGAALVVSEQKTSECRAVIYPLLDMLYRDGGASMGDSAQQGDFGGGDAQGLDAAGKLRIWR
jgi:hypothetical protein